MVPRLVRLPAHVYIITTSICVYILCTSLGFSCFQIESINLFGVKCVLHFTAIFIVIHLVPKFVSGITVKYGKALIINVGDCWVHNSIVFFSNYIRLRFDWDLR